ncbi:hypothetical protein T01_2093, partial [Trichinella spiralis]
MLSNVSVGQSEDWDDHLDRVLLTYRPSIHHTTGATPCRIIGHGLREQLRLSRQRSGRRMKLPYADVYLKGKRELR